MKRWLATKNEMNTRALIALAYSLESEEMLTLFGHLSLEDRKEWKKKLDRELRQEEFLIAFSYIQKQIARGLILPPIVSDNELIETLSTLTISEYSQICKQNVKAGAMLLKYFGC